MPEPAIEPALDPVHEVYEALVLGTRDYVQKNGFADVVIAATHPKITFLDQIERTELPADFVTAIGFWIRIVWSGIT